MPGTREKMCIQKNLKPNQIKTHKNMVQPRHLAHTSSVVHNKYLHTASNIIKIVALHVIFINQLKKFSLQCLHPDSLYHV